jgi:hypothetical protein
MRNRFGRGGVYRCQDCGKRTRDTDGEGTSGQCRKCRDEAEQANAHADGVHDALGPVDGCPVCRATKQEGSP